MSRVAVCIQSEIGILNFQKFKFKLDIQILNFNAKYEDFFLNSTFNLEKVFFAKI